MVQLKISVLKYPPWKSEHNPHLYSTTSCRAGLSAGGRLAARSVGGSGEEQLPGVKAGGRPGAPRFDVYLGTLEPDATKVTRKRWFNFKKHLTF